MYYNLILDKLPNFTPNGFKIRTNFRESIKFELLMQNDKINENDKVKLALNLYFYLLSLILAFFVLNRIEILMEYLVL